MTDDTSPHRRRAGRDAALGAVLLAAVVLSAWAALSPDRVAGAVSRIAALSPWQVAALLALSLSNYALRGLRWHLFARRLGLALSPARSLVQFTGGFALSLTPARVGELVRLRWLARRTGAPLDRLAVLPLADRAADLSAMALLVAAGLALSPGRLPGAAALVPPALALAVVATRPALLRRAARLGLRACRGRAPRGFARLSRAGRALGRLTDPGTVAAACALGLAGWLAEGAALHLLLGWLGVDMAPARAVAIFVLATLAGGLTGLPGGLGGAEAAMLALLALDGVPPGTALAATLVIRATTLWFALVLGALAFPLAEAGARRHPASRPEGRHALGRG